MHQVVIENPILNSPYEEGEKKKDKEAKVATARTLWVPAVNNHGGFGGWDFIEITDPWSAKSLLRRYLDGVDPVPAKGQGDIAAAGGAPP